MPFLRHKSKAPNVKVNSQVSYMAKAGLNLKDLPELLNPSYAIKNENYFVKSNGGLHKRGGIIEMITRAINKAPTMIKPWKGYFIFGYDKTIAAYNPLDGTITDIKTDWNTDAKFDGAPYGDFFFTGNTGNKVNYITESSGVFTITEIPTAPMSGVLKVIGPRLYAGVGTEVLYCGIDDGTDPPFTVWTISQSATDGGKASFRNAGDINSICSLGDIIIAFGDYGKWAFRITTQNDGIGNVVKTEDVVIDRIDMGGASGAITTPKGVFYVNSGGLWQLISLGQPNIPFSEQEGLTTINLGTDYFNDVNLDNCDLVYYARYSSVLITCAKQATSNNHVIVYNPDAKAFSIFTNWVINRWMSFENEIYAVSSVKMAIYKCFAGNSDNGASIGTNYLQEIHTGNLWTRQMLYGAYIKGLLSQNSNITVAFDIYDRTGSLIENKLRFAWTNHGQNTDLNEWGSAEWGKGEWGGDIGSEGLIENFDGMHSFIRNFQRIRVHITESSKLGHRIDWFSLDTRVKSNIRRRKLVKL